MKNEMNLPVELAQQKLDLLSRSLPNHASELTQSKEYLHTDPGSAIIKMRLVLESIMQELWSNEFPHLPSPTLADIMNHDQIKGQLDRRIHSRMNSMRITANLAAHPNKLKTSDALISVDHLFEILDWYLSDYLNRSPLPALSDPPHPFSKFIGDGLKDLRFLMVLSGTFFFTLLITRFAEVFPVFRGTPISKVYEGLFKMKGFAFAYSVGLIFISFLAAWLIFRRFRRQNLTSRILSFQLMFAFFFSLQLLFLIFADPFSKLF